VKHTDKREYNGIMRRIVLSNGKEIKCTPEHPFFVIDRGWVEAKDLSPDCNLKSAQDEIIYINMISNIRFFNAYNFISGFFEKFIPPNVFSKILMPIFRIYFEADIKSRKEEVDSKPFNLKLLFKGYSQKAKSLLHKGFYARLISGECNKLSKATARAKPGGLFGVRSNPKPLPAIFAGNINGRSSATFGAMPPDTILTGIKENFAATLTSIKYAQGVSTSDATNVISVGVTLGDSKKFSADRAFFGYLMKFVSTFKRTEASLHARRKIKRFFTIFTRDISSLAGCKVIAFIRTIYLSFVGWLKSLIAMGTVHVASFYRYVNDYIHKCQALNVYNIEVEAAHAYYAEGALVHNCEFCVLMDNEVQELTDNFFNQGQEMQGAENTMVFDYSSIASPPLHPNCYDIKTEVYTERGFIKIKKVHIGEKVLTLNPQTKELEWDYAIRKIERFEEKIYELKNKQHSFDMAVTKDHPFFGLKRIDRGRKGRNLEVVWRQGIESLNSEFVFYLSSEHKGRNTKTVRLEGLDVPIKQYCEFMGYYLSEGSITQRIVSGKIKYQIKIAQEKYIDRYAEAIKNMPFRKIWIGKKQIVISDDKLARYLIQFGKSPNKYVPQEIKDTTVKNIKIFLDAFCSGDGNIKKGNEYKNGNFKDSRSFSTSSRRMADDLGELIIRSGMAVRYSVAKNAGKVVSFKNGDYKINNDQYNIAELTSKYRKFDKIKIEEKKYYDFVYDIEVAKNHTLLTRRNGRVVWGSNCRCSLIAVLK